MFQKRKLRDAPGSGIETGYEGRTLKDVLPQREKMWWHFKNLRLLNFLLIGCLMTDFTNGYDGSMLNGLQSIPQWEEYFDHPSGSRLGVITNGNRFGQIGGLVVSAWLCQRLGRRKPIILGSVILLAGVVLQAAANGMAMFVIGRVLIGFGNCIQVTACPILISELAYPTTRSTMVGFSNSSGPLGSLVAAWITYGTLEIAGSWSWRLPSVLQAFSSIVQIAFSLFVPESPRWLVTNNRREEAYKILTKYHGEGDESSELLQFEMAEIDLAIEAERTQSLSSWREWFRTRGNQYRFCIIMAVGFMIQWCGNAIISYYLHKVLNAIGVTDPKRQLLINGGTNINGFFWGVFFSLWIEKIGRRPLFLIGFAGMFCAFVTMTALAGVGQSQNFKSESVSNGYIAMIFLFGMFYKFPGPMVPSYVAEVSPNNLRAKAFVIHGFADVCASVFSNFTNPIGMDAIKWKYYIVWCCLLVSNFTIAYFFFPETKGLSLEEVNQKIDRMTGSESYDEKKVEEEHIEVVTEKSESK